MNAIKEKYLAQYKVSDLDKYGSLIGIAMEMTDEVENLDLTSRRVLQNWEGTLDFIKELSMQSRLDKLPKLTKADLDIYLNSLERQKRQLRPTGSPEDIERLNRYAEEAIYRFYNQ